ncbi:PREDICTED: uncharacterized protein LOC109583930 [Amphimedon queenslandica]|uniref:Uncharacterized protein n=1 Tax=Amphimedon queenslandica TaxID=400682 RepID=A0AAN0JDC0_AMPQE|nr:PREDICTED: uncharacterized protein LOC109583930 [Amphimedon queenslandica]|eukprot:XP_019855025.1 PREDICTED: uncharacterized protein LOC109583930 [Amphimedon queenslandica]
MSRIISLYLLIVATLLQLGSTTDPVSALSDLKSGVRFLRGILNHGTRVTLLPSIKYLSPMLEILRLRADIEKDAAVHKVLVHLEDSICEEVEEKTREVAMQYS